MHYIYYGISGPSLLVESTDSMMTHAGIMPGCHVHIWCYDLNVPFFFNIPAHYSYLKELVPEINQCVDKFLDNLESSAHSKSPVLLRDKFSLLTLNVISKVSRVSENVMIIQPGRF